MLILVEDVASKPAAQKAMEETVKNALKNQGTRTIGFPGGKADAVVYSNGDDQLFCAFGSGNDAAIPRRWNAFGVFGTNRKVQTITVEINTPTKTNSASVAGFFARDPASGKTYLMHDGSIGGGKTGVGRKGFLACSKTTLHDVLRSDGPMRPAILIGDVAAKDLPARLWRYVRLVRDFKNAVSEGLLDDKAIRRAVDQWNIVRSASSGRRRGTCSSQIDYISYHDDVVARLTEERKARRASGEQILHNVLVDLYVRSGKKLTEVYEIKTSLDRPSLAAPKAASSRWTR